MSSSTFLTNMFLKNNKNLEQHNGINYDRANDTNSSKAEIHS